MKHSMMMECRIIEMYTNDITLNNTISVHIKI